jgi:hypothetical protein
LQQHNIQNTKTAPILTKKIQKDILSFSISFFKTKLSISLQRSLG